MKNYKIAAAILMVLLAGPGAHAQFNLKNLAGKAASAVKQGAGNANGSSNATSSASVPAASGKKLYVSATTGSARADGLSATTAMKDLQKAIDAAEENDVILVAEGNYLGNLDRGYVESGRFGNAQNERGKFFSIYGGYSTDFSERDVIKHVTKIQPTSQKFTAPLMNINAKRPYGYTGPVGNLVIDGFVFDLGENNRYCVKNVDGINYQLRVVSRRRLRGVGSMETRAGLTDESRHTLHTFVRTQHTREAVCHGGTLFERRAVPQVYLHSEELTFGLRQQLEIALEEQHDTQQGRTA